MICAIVLIVNLSKEPIVNRDLEAVNIAKQHCGELYKDAPCVKKFVKMEPLVYRITCGAADSK